MTAKTEKLTPTLDTVPAWLQKHRTDLDALDNQIVDLLCVRHGIVRQVGEAKAIAGMAAILPDRLQDVMDKTTGRAAEKGGDAGLVKRIYEEILRTACAMEEDIINGRGEPE